MNVKEDDTVMSLMFIYYWFYMKFFEAVLLLVLWRERELMETPKRKKRWKKTHSGPR